MMSEKERLLKILEQEQLSARQFAEEVGIQPGTISNIINDRNKPSLEVMQKVLKRFSAISSDWLILEKGAMYRQKNDSQQPVLFDLPPEEKSTLSDNDTPTAVSTTTSDTIPVGKPQPQSQEQPALPTSKRIKKIMIFFDDNTFEEFSK